ncbi:unnamed protein product [Urochloa humidicola]
MAYATVGRAVALSMREWRGSNLATVTATKSGMALARGGWRTPAQLLAQGQRSRGLRCSAPPSGGGAGGPGKVGLDLGMEMVLDLDIAAGHDERAADRVFGSTPCSLLPIIFSTHKLDKTTRKELLCPVYLLPMLPAGVPWSPCHPLNSPFCGS